MLGHSDNTENKAIIFPERDFTDLLILAAEDLDKIIPQSIFTPELPIEKLMTHTYSSRIIDLDEFIPSKNKKEADERIQNVLTTSRQKAKAREEKELEDKKAGKTPKVRKAPKATSTMGSNPTDHISENFYYHILKKFEGKNSFFFYRWLKKISPTIQEKKEISFIQFSIKKENQLINIPKFTGNNQLINLTVDVTNWNEEDFKNVADQIKNRPIFNIDIKGTPQSKEMLINFLDKLKKVDLFNADPNSEIAAIAKRFTHRNQLVMSFPDIPVDSYNIWEHVIHKWKKTTELYTCDSRLASLLSANEIGPDDDGIKSRSLYRRYLNSLYGRKEYDFALSPHHKTLAEQYELVQAFNSCIDDDDDCFLEFLKYLTSDAYLSQKQTEVMRFDFNLREKSIEILTQYAERLPFEHIYLTVNEELINTPQFIKLLNELNKSGLKELHLVFRKNIKKSGLLHEQVKILDLNNIDIENLHQHKVFLKYFITINSQWGVNSQRRKASTFEQNQIKYHRLKKIEEEKKQIASETKLQPKIYSIPKTTHKTAIGRKYEIEQELNVENIKDTLAETEQNKDVDQMRNLDQEMINQLDSNSGNIMDYKQFHSFFNRISSNDRARYNHEITEKLEELFNSGHILNELFDKDRVAISYEAGIQLLKKDIFLYAMNPHNLAKNYSWKQQNGKLVLHYHPGKTSALNPFTPKHIPLLSEDISETYSSELNSKIPELKKFLHDTFFDEKQSDELLISAEKEKLLKIFLQRKLVERRNYNNESFKKAYLSYINLMGEFFKDTRKMQNLYRDHDIDGIKQFLTKIKDAWDPAFIVTHYLAYYSDLTLLTDENFFLPLRKTKNYPDVKKLFLEKFLENAGCTYNFAEVITSFEIFWNTFKKLCDQQKPKLELDKIELSFDWQCLPGSPLVAMERMLHILQNSRNLLEQLTCLKGLTLNRALHINHKHFKVASKMMDIDSAERKTVTLSSLTELYTKGRDKKYQEEAFDKNCLMYVASETEAIHFNEYLKILNRIQGHFEPTKKVEVLFFTTLLYDPTFSSTIFDDVIPLLHSLNNQDKQTIRLINQCLLDNNKHTGSKLSINDAKLILRHINSLAEPKEQNIRKIFEYFNTDSTTTIQVLNRINENKGNLDVTLNLTNILLEEKEIKKYFTPPHSLMLFAASLRQDDSKTNLVKQLIPYLKNVCDPDNKELPYKYVFQFIVDTNIPMNIEGCLNAFREIESTKPKEYSEIRTILEKHFLPTSKKVIFEDENENIKLQLVKLIHEIKNFGTKVNKEKKAYLEELKKSSLLPPQTKMQEMEFYYYIQKQIREQWNGAVFSGFISSVDSATNFFEFSDPLIEQQDFIKDAKNNSLDDLFQQFNITLKQEAEILKNTELYQSLKNTTDGIDISKIDIYTIQESSIFYKLLIDEISYIKEMFFLSKILEITENQKRYTSDKNVFERASESNEFIRLARQIYAIIVFYENTYRKIDEWFVLAFNGPRVKAIIQSIQKINPSLSKEALELLKFLPNADKLQELKYDNFNFYLSLLQYLKPNNKIVFEKITETKLLYRERSSIEEAALRDLINSKNKPENIIKIISLWDRCPSIDITYLVQHFSKIPHDNLMKFILKNYKTIPPSDLNIIEITNNINDNDDRNSCASFFKKLYDNKISLRELNPILEYKEKSPIVLSIIAKLYLGTEQFYPKSKTHHARVKKLNNIQNKLKSLSPKNLLKLNNFLNNTLITTDGLLYGLKQYKKEEDFNLFLQNLEISPFGERPRLPSDFDEISENLDRIINFIKDMNNDSVISYEYRLTLLECLQSVSINREEIKSYVIQQNNKTIKKSPRELSNQEIQELFLTRKKTNNEFLTKEDLLFILPLMSEAMYRATKQYPNTMQLIALIDTVLHKGNHISKINTGQGKSLVDTMKASLLWLMSDRVDVIISSYADAERDVTLYGKFLKLLNIPYSSKPLLPQSNLNEYQANGINFGTTSAFSFMEMRALYEGRELGKIKGLKGEAKTSLVINESDRETLDNMTINRLSISDPDLLDEDVWIYTAINRFIDHELKDDDSSSELQLNISALRKFLHEYKTEPAKREGFVNGLTDDKLIQWTMAALSVKNECAENEDYIIPNKTIFLKLPDGNKKAVRETKLVVDTEIDADGRKFGQGRHAFLHARLNESVKYQSDTVKFHTTAETRNVLSISAKNLIDQRIKSRGLVWGSSATPAGTRAEIEEQRRNFGFSFTEIPSFYNNRPTIDKPNIQPDEKSQFASIIDAIKTIHKNKPKDGYILPFKDIKTTLRFQECLASDPLLKEFSFDIQYFFGERDEEHDVISKAGNAHTMTVCTLALGRNKNIRTDDKQSCLHLVPSTVLPSRMRDQLLGRVGRQEDLGAIHAILNQSELNETARRLINLPSRQNIEVDALRELLDKELEEMRQHTNQLYDLTGSFIQELRIQRKTFMNFKGFLENEFFTFTENLKNDYYYRLNNNSYQHESFCMEYRLKFEDLVSQQSKIEVQSKKNNVAEQKAESENIQVPATLDFKQIPKYKLHSEKLRPDHVLNPYIKALSTIHFNDNLSRDSKHEALKNYLTNIFKEDGLATINTNIKDYVMYLNQSSITLAEYKEIHQVFIRQLLSYENQKEWGSIAQNKNRIALVAMMTQLINEPLLSFSDFKTLLSQHPDFMKVLPEISSIENYPEWIDALLAFRKDSPSKLLDDVLSISCAVGGVRPKLPPLPSIEDYTSELDQHLDKKEEDTPLLVNHRIWMDSLSLQPRTIFPPLKRPNSLPEAEGPLPDETLLFKIEPQDSTEEIPIIIIDANPPVSEVIEKRPFIPEPINLPGPIHIPEPVHGPQSLLETRDETSKPLEAKQKPTIDETLEIKPEIEIIRRPKKNPATGLITMGGGSVGSSGGVLIGMKVGASIGGAIGLPFGLVGSIPTAVIGAIIGGIVGFVAGGGATWALIRLGNYISDRINGVHQTKSMPKEDFTIPEPNKQIRHVSRYFPNIGLDFKSEPEAKSSVTQVLVKDDLSLAPELEESLTSDSTGVPTSRKSF